MRAPPSCEGGQGSKRLIRMSMKMENKMGQIPQDDAYLTVQPHPLDPLDRWHCSDYAKGQKWGVGPEFMATKQRGTMGTVIFIDRIHLFTPIIHLKLWQEIKTTRSMNIQLCSSIFLNWFLFRVSKTTHLGRVKQRPSPLRSARQIPGCLPGTSL